MGKVVKSPYAVNYRNRDEVIAYAKQFGHGLSVVKFNNRDNYNIIHTANEEERRKAYGEFSVEYRT